MKWLCCLFLKNCSRRRKLWLAAFDSWMEKSVFVKEIWFICTSLYPSRDIERRFYIWGCRVGHILSRYDRLRWSVWKRNIKIAVELGSSHLEVLER